MEHATIGETTMVPVDKVTPHPDNARRGNAAVIEKSLREFGQYAALIVQESTGYILKGNNTFRIMRDKLGSTAVLVTYVKVTDATARAILAVDNKSSDDSEYDTTALARLLQRIDDDDLLGATGYADDDLAALLAQIDADAVAAAPVELDPLGEPEPEPKPAKEPAAPKLPDVPDAEPANEYDGSATLRMFVVNYIPEQHAWLVARMRELREEWQVETNADMILSLVEEASSQVAPRLTTEIKSE